MALTKVTGDFIKDGVLTQAHLHSSHGITSSHIGEGDKLFFTNARARGAISVSGNALSYNSSTGVITSNFEESPTFTGNVKITGTQEKVLELDTTADTGAIHFEDNGTIRGILGFSNGSTISSSASNHDMVLRSEANLLLTTNTGNVALTLDTSQNATFSGNVVINGSGSSGNAIDITRGSDNASALRVQNSGEVVTQANYFYASASGVSMYVQNTAVFRGSIMNDASGAAVRIGDALTIDDDLTVTGGDITLGGTGRIQGIDTVSAGTDAANKTYVDNQVAGIVDSAPSTLDTLNELAAALGDDANFSTTVTNSIATKLPLAGGTLTGALSGTSATFSGIGQFAGAIRITETGTAQHILIGNQDSGGTNKPGMIRSANASLEFGYGNSWSGEGGTMTTSLTIGSDSNATFVGAVNVKTNKVQIDQDGTYGSGYGTIGFGGKANGFNRVFGATGTGDGLFLASASGRGVFIRVNGSAADTHTFGSNGYVGMGIVNTSNQRLTLAEADANGSHLKMNNSRSGGGYWVVGVGDTNSTSSIVDPGGLFFYNGSTKLKLDSSGNATFAGTVTWSGGSSTNANTAYGWGNHASANYWVKSGTWYGDLGSHSYTREMGLAMTGGSEFVVLSKSGQGSVLIDGHYMAYESANGFFGSFNSTYGNLTGIRASAANTLKVMQLDGGNAILLVTQDVRAPLYYDSADTAYYVDPNSTTSLKTVGSWRSNSSTWDGEFNGKIQHHSNWWYMQSSNGVLIRNSSGSNTITLSNSSGQITANADVRSPIFYDLNDTAYYLNPASTSNLNDVEIVQLAIDGYMYHKGDTDTYLGFDTTDSIRFVAGNSERMIINTDGIQARELKGVRTNLATSEGWAETNAWNAGTQTGYYGGNFSINGASDENNICYIEGPSPNSGSLSQRRVLAWKCSYNGSGSGADGGWNKTITGVDYNKAHISVVYVKRVADGNGNFYHGTTTCINLSDGSSNSNPYFIAMGSQSLPLNVWCVSIGYLQANNDTATTSNSSFSGIYRLDTGERIHGCTDFRMAASSTSQHRAFLYYASNTATEVHMCNPGFYEVNGSEPNINELLMRPRDLVDSIRSDVDMRTPVFYDSNNTAYYLNPADTSTSLSTAGKVYVQGGHGSARVHINYDHGSDDGNSGALTSWVSEPGITYHSAGIGGNINVSGQYYGRAYNAGYGSYVRFDKSNGNVEHWVTTGNAGTAGGQGSRQWYNDNAGNSFATTSSRAPIFYDSDDTGYYVNPATGSNLKGIVTNTSSSAVGSQLKIYSTTNHQYPQIHSNAAYEAMWNYKNNTVEWYVGVRTSTQLLGNTGFHFYNTSQGQTVGGWDVNGHSYSIGSSRAPIFYDSNDTGYYLDANSTGTALKLRGYQIFNDFGAGIVGSYSANRYQLVFAMGNSYKGALDGTNVTGGYGLWYSHPNAGGVAANLNSHGLMNIVNGAWQASLAGSTRANEDMRAPIFYDLNDTTYYSDPGGSSLTNNHNIKGTINFPSSGGTTHGSSHRPAYGIYQEGGAWSSPFPDLVIAMHTGIKFGANASYNGMRFYNDYGMVTQVMSINNHADGLGSNHVYVNNSLAAGGSLRAPIFYEHGNTSYYIDAASTSNLNALTLIGTLSGQNGLFAQSISVGHTGSAGGKIHIQRSSAGTGIKNDYGGTLTSSTIGLHQYTSASMFSNGYHLVFQAAPGSGSDTNMLLCDINGNLRNRNNSYGQYSDIKLKENISDATPKLEDINKLKVKNFNLKGDNLKQIGLIAQEVEQVFPSLVEDTISPEGEDIKSLKYSVLVPILIKGMQEQQVIINDLKTRLETLENQ